MTFVTLTKRIAETVLPLHEDFAQYRDTRLWRDLDVRPAELSDEALALIIDTTDSLPVPEAKDDAKTEKATVGILQAVQRVRAGEDKPVSGIAALANMVIAWVDANCERGWMVRKSRHDAGRDEVYLVVSSVYREGSHSGNEPRVQVDFTARAPGVASGGRGEGEKGRAGETLTFSADDLLTTDHTKSTEGKKAKRRRVTVGELLGSKGFFAPTEEDLSEHDETAEAFEQLLATGFASQYRHTGMLEVGGNWSRDRHVNVRGKVIHDIKPEERAASQPLTTVWASARSEEPVVRHTPTLPSLRVFDLDKQEFGVVDSRDLTPYAYDPSLRDKLVLPETHRELLDVLTTDLADYSDDIIEGKSAGNVILAQGRPGVGKTLTAEVYSEIVERPLYKIHSGSLGITAESVRKNLETIFARAARWDAVLLLDEADVFVLARGDSLDQNAIVAEFLRTLEYFKGLLFMTTNRLDAVDDAILSRCAAIIRYTIPDHEDALEVWRILVENVKAEKKVPVKMRQQLVATYPHLSPRDVKMALRLALRISAKRGENPTMEVFERCLLFRGLTRPDEETA